MTALQLCHTAAGTFFLVALISGVGKYIGIIRSERAEAPEYVSILHRAALLYSFAAMLLAEFVRMNSYSETVRFYAAAAVIAFFAFAQFTYLVHAVFNDTDNQFRKPYTFGPIPMPAVLIHGSMILLVAAEIGGFAVLFYGYLRTL